MLKKILKIVGSFLLVLVVLLAGAGLWATVSASKYRNAAKPFLEQNMPAVVSWDFNQLRPLLTPASRAQFETERGQMIYRKLSILGALESFEEPQFLTAQSGVSTTEGVVDVLKFSMLGHFEAGDATVTVNLAKTGDSYLIRYLHIDSDVFLQ